MRTASRPQPPELGSQVTTACGSPIRFAADMPYSRHEGRWVYFCLPLCKEAFEYDPGNSCLALEGGGERGRRGERETGRQVGRKLARGGWSGDG